MLPLVFEICLGAIIISTLQMGTIGYQTRRLETMRPITIV